MPGQIPVIPAKSRPRGAAYINQWTTPKPVNQIPIKITVAITKKSMRCADINILQKSVTYKTSGLVPIKPISKQYHNIYIIFLMYLTSYNYY